MNPPGSMEKASEHAWVTQEKVSRLRRWERYAKQGQRDGDRKGHLQDQGMVESGGQEVERGLDWIGELINKTGAESVSENSP